ncbi:MAG: xanthine dehydrogenase family protein [Anaerolineales bacterium]|nr:xanthine dehydrogenase family protein [Anaerolineales bacterium]
MQAYKYIGRPTPLIDGRAKVTGTTRFVADLPLPGRLHARPVLSLYAHARLKRIDTTAAARAPGVARILTAADLPEVPPSGRMQLLLARDRVIFAGQPIALVLAATEDAAEDAAALVQVEYEALPAAVTIDQALAPDAPLVWPDGLPGHESDAATHGAATGHEVERTAASNIAGTDGYTRGDVAAGFAEADIIVERSFTTPSVHQSSIEPQAVIARPDPDTGGVELWASTQGLFAAQRSVAKALGLPESLVKVTAAPVGGGFGAKNGLYEPLVAMAAHVCGQPVQMVLTRTEELLAGAPAPAARIHARLGAKYDGTLLALEAEVIIDDGCYPFNLAGFVAVTLGSVYNLPNLSLRATDVLTFKASAGAYRAPGAPSAAFAIESLIDELAGAAGLDPLELRQRHAVETGDLKANGKPWPGIGLRQVLAAVAEQPLWQNRAEARAAGRGVGLAVAAWPGGSEPAAAVCSLDRDGRLQVRVGAVDLHGTATSFALLAAETLGIAPEDVRVLAGDTETAPFAGASAGSKTTFSTGGAVVDAAREARRQVLAAAAELLEADVEDLDLADGRVQVRGVPASSLTLRELARKSMSWESPIAPISAGGRFAQPQSAPAFSAQLAEVEVDRETGEVRVHQLVVIQDVGCAVNPPAVDGQMMGGATQGLGWALYEAMVYDVSGQLLTGTLMDYAVPRFAQSAGAFTLVRVEAPSDNGPFGVRGVGEPPVIATAAAVANAIADAAGVRLTDLPMTPQRVWQALNSRSQSLEIGKRSRGEAPA